MHTLHATPEWPFISLKSSHTQIQQSFIINIRNPTVTHTPVTYRHKFSWFRLITILDYYYLSLLSTIPSFYHNITNSHQILLMQLFKEPLVQKTKNTLVHLCFHSHHIAAKLFKNQWISVNLDFIANQLDTNSQLYTTTIKYARPSSQVHPPTRYVPTPIRN